MNGIVPSWLKEEVGLGSWEPDCSVDNQPVFRERFAGVTIINDLLLEGRGAFDFVAGWDLEETGIRVDALKILDFFAHFTPASRAIVARDDWERSEASSSDRISSV